jgi:glutamine transport system substrate-binding protein
MKKWTWVLITLITCIGLTACGGGNNGASGGDKVKFATEAQYAPMIFMDKDKVTGFDVDIATAIMEEAGLDWSITNMGWDTMLESVKQGTEYKASIAAVSITDDRKLTYDFSVPYFESRNLILVPKGSDIKNALDLKGKKVAVQLSTTADILMTDIMGRDNTDLKRFDSNAVALMELDTGGVDAVVADMAIVWEYVENNPNDKYEYIIDTENFTPEYYGILLPKGSELKAKLDPAIKAILENGKYAEVYKKWFGEEPNVEGLLNAE